MILPNRITNPFPGLRPFEPNQADLFFGRDEQIEELVDRLQEHRFVAIVGASGSGKSSLVRAGLIPVLKRSQVGFMASGWRIAMMRPGANATEELAKELSRLFGDPQDPVFDSLRTSSAGLAKYARQKLDAGESLLLLVDQFEELFRYREQSNNERNAEGAAAFVKLLLAASGHSSHPLPGLEDVPVYVVITMRSDFLGKCAQFRGLPEVLNDSQYLVPRMTRDEQREAIEGPVRMVQGQIAANLVQRMLNEVGDNPDQLPVLQHALMRSWEHASGTRANGSAIEVKDYDDVGGMKEALNRDADEAFAALPNDESKTIARNLFQKLVEPGAPDEETRRPTPLSELVAVTACPEAKVREVIEVFRTRGFLTESGDDDPIVDISHESLIRNWKRLGEWVIEESRSAAIYRRLADTAELYRKKEAGLLLDPQLSLSLDWSEKTEPNEAWARRYYPGFREAIAFLEESETTRESEIDRIERQRRKDLNRARLVAFIFAALFVVAAVTFVMFDRAQREASKERNERNRLRYDSNIYVAQRSAEDGQLVQAQTLLDELAAPGLSDLRGFDWFHLWRIVHADDATLSGHSDSASAVAFSPDGKIVASGSLDKTVKLWDAASHQQLVTLSGHSDQVSALVFSSDGKTLASSSLDKTVKLWDTASYQEIATLTGHSEAVRSLAFSPDSKTLATCSDDMTVKLWDVHAVKEIATFTGHKASVAWVAFSPDGKLVASSSEDHSVKLWDVASRKELATLVGHTREVWAVVFSPDGKVLASSSDDGTVRLWEIPSGKDLATLDAHTGPIWSIVFSPDGQTFATGSLDRSIKLWNTGSLKRILTLVHPDSVFALAFSPNGKTLASANADKSVIIWDTTSHKGYATLAGHADGVSAVAFQPTGGQLLASSSEDGTVKLWDTISRKEVATLKGHEGSVKAVAFSPDAQIVASGGQDTNVKLWSATSHEELATLKGHSATVLAVAFSPDGKTLASGAADNTVKLWDVATQKQITTLNHHSGSVRALAFSPDGRTLATASNDKTAKLWDVASGKIVATLTGHAEEVTALAFSHDGQKLVTTSTDKTVKLWDVASHAELMTLAGHSNYVLAVAFSPNDAILASGSLDRTVILWNIISGRELMRLTGHTDSVTTVVFSPDGRTLATGSGSNDRTIKLWLSATEAEVSQRRPRP